jgi:peptidoglycan/LPS O-acetylase OafA/YrhL
MLDKILKLLGMRFAAIDGLRGWLAWAVVIAHIVQFGNLEAGSSSAESIVSFGPIAVMVFVVISGFVICGRVIDVNEPWWPYIIRRFFRIFPLYWFLLVIAAFLTPFAAVAYNAMQWAHDPPGGVQVWFHDWNDLMLMHPVTQWGLHLTLLQGIVSDSFWPRTSTNMLGPAWSLSLEWQFYLVAPLFVGLLMNRKYSAITVAASLLSASFFAREFFGTYALPAFLPISAYLFMIGISSRLGFEQLQKATLPTAIIIAVLFFIFLDKDLRWLGIWGCVFIYLLNERRWKADPDIITRLMSAGLDSKWALYFGERSYSVYLAHIPVIYVLLLFLAPLELSKWQATAAFAVLTVVFTAIVSNILYRYIEQPFIRLGSRIARQQAAHVLAK